MILFSSLLFFSHSSVRIFILLGIGLISLDPSLFKKKSKSILIISPKKYKQVDTLATMLPPAKDEIKYREALVDIKNWLKRF